MRLEALADDGVVMPGQPVEAVVRCRRTTGRPTSTVTSVDLAGLERTHRRRAAARCRRRRAYTCTGTGDDSCVSRAVTGPVLDAADRRRALRLRARTCRSACRSGRRHSARRSTLSIGGADVQVDRVRRVPLQRPLRRREADGAAGRAGIHRARLAPDIADRSRRRGRSARSDTAHARASQVVVTNQHKGRRTARVSLHGAARLDASTPARAPVKFAREDEEATVTLRRRRRRRPPRPARLRDRRAASVTAEARRHDTGYEVVEYPHIHRRHVLEAGDDARQGDRRQRSRPDLRVGYVMGVGDEVPQAIEQLGAEVDLIDADAAGVRRSVALQRDRHRRARLRAPAGSAREQQPAARLRGERRHGAGAVQQVRVQRGAVRTVSGEGRRRPRHRRERADRGARSGSSGLQHAEQDRSRDMGRLGAGARARIFSASAIRATSIWCDRAIRFRYNPGAKTGALVEARYGKGAGSTSVSASGGSCPPGTDGAYQLMANLLASGKQ